MSDLDQEKPVTALEYIEWAATKLRTEQEGPNKTAVKAVVLQGLEHSILILKNQEEHERLMKEHVAR